MVPLTRSEALARAGRFREAAELLDEMPRREGRTQEALRAEVYEAIGRVDEAKECVDAILSSKLVTDEERGRAEFVLSRIHAEDGDLDAELIQLQKAILHLERAKDLRGVCFSQFRLLHLVDDRSGPDAAQGLMRQVRANVTR